MSSDQYADDRVYLREDTRYVALPIDLAHPGRGGWLYVQADQAAAEPLPGWYDAELAEDGDDLRDLALPDPSDDEIAAVVEQHTGPIGVARFEYDHDHNPTQHRDGRPPWCSVCRRTMTGAYVAPGSSWQRRHGGRS